MKKIDNESNLIKQKISKINWFILIIVFIIELLIININLISNLNISIYNNKFVFWKVMIVNSIIDICFALAMIDFSINQKKPKKLFNIYKKDVNIVIRKLFWIIEFIKLGLVLYTIRNNISEYSIRYISMILIYISIIVIYYVLCLVLPRRDNISKKLRILKRQINNDKSKYKFILIDGVKIPSTFNIENIPNYRVSKDNIYIDIENEYNTFTDKQKEFIKKNTIAVIHEVKKKDLKNIIKIYESQKINTYKTTHIMAVEDVSKVELNEYTSFVNSIKICDVDSAIEYTENLFTISSDKKIKSLKLIFANRNLNKIKSKISKRNIEISEEDKKTDLTISKDLSKELEKEYFTEKDIDLLNIIYQNNYYTRLNLNIENLPNDRELFELYKNAYLNESPYESILKFFSYITSICKVVEYSLYAKNNSKFNSKEIFTDIISDNPPVWTNHITLNVYKKKDDLLYKNIRENKFDLSKDEEVLLKVYLSKMLNSEIIGDNITFTGLTYLFKEFRNKVEAHGIINDANVYAVWNLTFFFANTLNRMLKVFEIDIEKNENSTISVGFGKGKKVNLGKYILVFDNHMYFIRDVIMQRDRSIKRLYINYFTGDVKYEIDE